MLSGKESACNAGDIGDMGLIPGLGRDPWVGKSSLEKEMATTPVFLPGKSHGQKSLVATVHGLAKESNTT